MILVLKKLKLMFSSSQKNLFYFWSLMATLCSYERQNYNSFMFKLYQCCVSLLCSTFIYLYYVQKILKHVKIISIKKQKQNKKFYKDEKSFFFPFLHLYVFLKGCVNRYSQGIG